MTDYEMFVETVENKAEDVRRWQEEQGFNDRSNLMDAIDTIEEGYREKDAEKVEEGLQEYHDTIRELHPTEKSIIGAFFRQAQYNLEHVKEAE